MQIVIDINDKLYTQLFEIGVDSYDIAVNMAKARHFLKDMGS